MHKATYKNMPDDETHVHAAESQFVCAAASLDEQEHGKALNLLLRQSTGEASAINTLPHRAFYVSVQDVITVQVQKALEDVKSNMRAPLVPDKLRPMLIGHNGSAQVAASHTFSD